VRSGPPSARSRSSAPAAPRTRPARSPSQDLRPAALAAAVVLVATTAPVSGPAGAPPLAALLVHAVLFGAVAAALSVAWHRQGWGRPILGPVVVATTYGALTEAVQLLLRHRTGDPVDVVADAVGALFGALAVAAWMVRRRPGTAAGAGPAA
jgi:VanZ family protein